MRGEIELARDGQRCPTLIELERPARRPAHAHRRARDGRDSIDAMVRGGDGARLRVHAPSPSTARRSPWRTASTPRACASRSARSRPRASGIPTSSILHGLEVDILADGDAGPGRRDAGAARLGHRLHPLALRAAARRGRPRARSRAVPHPAVHAFGASDRPADRLARAACAFDMERVAEARGRARRGDGDQRLARAAGPLRRERAARAREGLPVRDRHGRARHRASRTTSASASSRRDGPGSP